MVSYLVFAFCANDFLPVVQGASTHGSISSDTPSQSAPLCSGAGLLHTRFLFLTPPPHVFEQGVTDHKLQPPSTETKKYIHDH